MAKGMQSGARQHVEIPMQMLMNAPIQYLFVRLGFSRKRVDAKRTQEKPARKINEPFKIWS